ncbi:MAG TPA: DUF1801 domain-containing protein [Acidimicrobiales bacterium]|nr:DUF1801 domain-containing protein [Acidimicrobiales bacterium]
MPEIDEAVSAYIDALPEDHRRLFERFHQLILRTRPEVVVVLSYKMPTYQIDKRRLHVGAWSHGLSIYGWQQGREAAFTSRHPGLKTSKGTIRLSPQDAAALSDDDLIELVRAALDP